jgi:very-short-patch-repair endonuclease
MPHRKRSLHAVTTAKTQRAAPSQAETLLWRTLRNSGIDAKFRRQVPIGPYVVDFVCLEHRLVVESDGPAHERPDQQAHDAERDRFLKAQGFRVLRLPNDLVRGATELTVQRIRWHCQHHDGFARALIRPLLTQRPPSPARGEGR